MDWLGAFSEKASDRHLWAVALVAPNATVSPELEDLGEEVVEALCSSRLSALEKFGARLCVWGPARHRRTREHDEKLTDIGSVKGG